jgi:hypothetical protein
MSKLDEIIKKHEQCKKIIKGAEETIKYCNKPYIEKSIASESFSCKLYSHLMTDDPLIEIRHDWKGESFNCSIKEGEILYSLLKEIYE